MNRSLKLSLLLALGLVGTHAAALELGQIQIKSALGQPLLAEIPLTPESPAELRNLSARLASADDFARAGISGGRPTIPLHFSIAGNGAHKVIRITSSEPVSDPYLDLLVEVNSAAGKSVREFAILLDPPGTGPAPSQPATSSAARVASTPPAASSTSATSTAAGATAPATHAATAGNGQVGPVERGQTLTSIVRQNTPPGISENQMLVAFKQANPSAFYRDNVNALKSGVVLRVPTSEEAQALGAAAALAEIRRENSDWRAGATRSPTAVADAATGTGTSSAPTSAAGNGDRLELVPAKQGGKNEGGTTGGKGSSAATAQLRQDLARNQETVSTLQAQSSELKSRVKDLEDINGKNQRLLSLKNSEIADLQQQLEKARKAGSTPATARSTASAPMAPAASASAATPAAEHASESATVAPATGGSVAQNPAGTPATAQSTSAAPATPGTAAAAAATKPAVQPASKPAVLPAPPADEAPWYMQTWAWAAGAGVIVLLLLLALLGRRRKPAAVAATAPSLADRFGAVPMAAGGDPDEEELLDQLAEHPDDIQLHLELATLYYSRGDVEHFEAEAEAMHAHIADPQQPEWQDMVRMGEDLAPSHPLFAAPADGEPAHDDYADDLPGDHHAPFDDEVDPLPAAPPLPPQQKNLGGYHFDFNLTGPRAREDHPHADEDVTRIAVPHAPTFDDEPIGTPLHADDHDAPLHDELETEPEPASSWNFEEPEAAGAADTRPMFEESTAGAPTQQFGQFSDDPVDTKLDLARAYMDMGDADGARAMLEEVQQEGNQMQRDAARHLLENIH